MENLLKDLKFLKENGFKTTTIDDFLKSKEERKILIFFDDAESDEMPMMIKPVKWEDMKKYFEREVKKLAKSYF